MAEQFDIIVIGGGTAGLVTASGCVRLGRKVAVLEKEALGGDCLWTGCVPTKALVASARLAHRLAHPESLGFEPQRVQIAPRQIMEAMHEMQRIVGRHDDPEKFRQLGIDVIEGEGRFVSSREVEVAGRRLAAKDIVIATGSRTAFPPIEGLESSGFLDHASFLKQESFPRSVVILGGGYIGIEFAQIFRRFGTNVTVVEMLDEIISREDPDVIHGVRELLIAEGIALRTGWAVKKVHREGMKVVTLENTRGEKIEVRVDEVFVATGRRGNVETLGLEAAGVKVERNYVVVDPYLGTTAPRVWACGDVHGGLQFTHVAAFEAVKLVRNMLFPGKSRVDYAHVPWALYTDPEVGHIGWTEPEANQAIGKENVRTYRVDMLDVDRAVVDRTLRGFVKLVCDRKGKILGAHAFCANASTLIEQVVLARKKGVKIGELAQLISPYPSMADALQKAASLYYRDLNTSWLGQLARRVAAFSHR